MKHESHSSLPTLEQCLENTDLLKYLEFCLDRKKFILDQLKDKICPCDMDDLLHAVDAYAAASWFAKKKGVGK